MKHLFITILLTLSGVIRLGATNPDSVSTRSFEKYKVRLIRDNEIVDSLFTEQDKPFCFFLRKDGSYALDISGECGASLFMPVNTSFSGRRPRQSYFKFTLKAKCAEDGKQASMVFDERLGGFCSGN